MKKKVFAVLAVLLCMLVVSAGAITKKTLGSRAGVFASPSKSSERLGTLYKGDTVGVEKTGSTWTKIVYGSYGSAYILTKHIKNSSSKPSESTTSYYAKVDDASVREYASSSAPRIAYLDYGQKVSVYSISGGWAKIRYGGNVAYVKSKSLSRKKPGSFATPTPRPRTTPKPTSNINDAFNTFTTVSYHASVTPNQASGYVNLRWGPSKSTKIAGVRYSGDVLKVIAQNDTWCQVMDETTGEVGYMMRRFLVEIPETMVEENSAADLEVG